MSDCICHLLKFNFLKLFFLWNYTCNCIRMSWLANFELSRWNVRKFFVRLAARLFVIEFLYDVLNWVWKQLQNILLQQNLFSNKRKQTLFILDNCICNCLLNLIWDELFLSSEFFMLVSEFKLSMLGFEISLTIFVAVKLATSVLKFVSDNFGELFC